MNTSGLTMVVAGLIALLTWAASRKVLSDNPVLSNPVIPICVAGLSYIGLTTLASGWAGAIVLLYAAMAIAILLILLFGWASRQRFHQAGKDSKDNQEPSKHHFHNHIANETTIEEGWSDHGHDE